MGEDGGEAGGKGGVARGTPGCAERAEERHSAYECEGAFALLFHPDLEQGERPHLELPHRLLLCFGILQASLCELGVTAI